MGCDCGKRVETPAEKAECEKSAESEALARGGRKIMGGCSAGHTPWFVFLHISGGFSNSNLETSKLKPLFFSFALHHQKLLLFCSWR